MEWGEKFAKAADAGERVGLKEGAELTYQVALESHTALAFGADMVLQHYRHPPEVTRAALIRAAGKLKQRGKRQTE